MVLITTKITLLKNAYAKPEMKFMVKIELYTSDEKRYFGGFTVPYEKAKYVILGVPFEHSLTYKTGTSLAPTRIREASDAIESFSLRANFDYDKCPVADLGDISVVPGDPMQTFNRISEVVSDIVASGKIPILIGGEHSITYGIIRGLREKSPCTLVFDAHFDSRDNYLGYKLSHASIMRRIMEVIGTRKIMFLGVRAFSEEEYLFIRSKNVRYVTSMQMLRNTVGNILKPVKSFLSECRSVHISIDMDVFDPAYAPGVDNPEPEGLIPTLIFDILYNIVDEKLLSLDVVEVSPIIDVNDVTSLLAAKVIKEAITYHYVKTISK